MHIEFPRSWNGSCYPSDSMWKNLHILAHLPVLFFRRCVTRPYVFKIISFNDDGGLLSSCREGGDKRKCCVNKRSLPSKKRDEKKSSPHSIFLHIRPQWKANGWWCVSKVEGRPSRNKMSTILYYSRLSKFPVKKGLTIKGGLERIHTKRSFSRGGWTSAADIEESMKILNCWHILIVALCWK